MSETSEGEIPLNFAEKNWKRALREMARPHYEFARSAAHGTYFGIITNTGTQVSRSTKREIFFSSEDIHIDDEKLSQETGPNETVVVIAWVRPPALVKEIGGDPFRLEHKKVVSDDQIKPNLQREIQRLSEIPADETVSFWPIEIIIVWEKGISLFHTEDITSNAVDEKTGLTPKIFIPWKNH